MADPDSSHQCTLSALRKDRKVKARPLPREAQKLQGAFEDAQLAYQSSGFASAVERVIKLAIRSHPDIPITRVVSLGLGSLVAPRTQGRRLKQLAVFLVIAEFLEQALGKTLGLFAQDPDFSNADEAFLGSFGIRILHTSSGSALGEAGNQIDESTLVYSPFLTADVYEQLLLHSELPVLYLFGDDFNALLNKWPKHSGEREQVEKIIKAGISPFKRRVVTGDGFWTEEDQAFPMAMYIRESKKAKT